MNFVVLWLAALVVFVGIEIATMGLTSIWFAAGALICVFLAKIGVPLGIQIILFLLVSLVLLFFTRPWAVRFFNRDRIKTNAESLVGRQALVEAEIDNLRACGQVTVGGMEWTARAVEDGMTIPAGETVEIVGIQGVKLIVKPGIRKRERISEQ